jgi:hypothetical protein
MSNFNFDKHALKRLIYWITEREAIRVKHDANDPKPWTKDKILQQYSFCNVHREDDRATRWIADNWRAPHASVPDLWFWMVIARLVNWPSTLAELHEPCGTWSPANFVDTLHAIRERGLKVFGGAYIVSTNGRAMDKAEYLAVHVLLPLWEHRAAVRPTGADSLASFHERLSGFNGMGSFMAAQVVADMKYVAPLADALDWSTFAASGPGSRRGLNRTLGLEVTSPWREPEWREWLLALQNALVLPLASVGIAMHAQDLQNCLCEFDKYERTRLGSGRPRSTYPGRA